VSRLLHVSSTRNRESISRHGLDWARMGAARGIAGSERPEVDGIFLCRNDFEADWFVRMNNTGGPVDVWGVDGVDEAELVESGNGYAHLPARIPPGQLTLIEREAVRAVRRTHYRGSSAAYQSSITITFDDGTVMRDADARDWVRKRPSE
jgi:hypothetical protein